MNVGIIKKNKKIPRIIGKSSKIKYWFICDNCSHSFDTTVSNVTNRKRPGWCPYCTKNSMMRKICGDSNCISCFNKSLASFKDTTPNGKLKINCLDNEKNKNIKPINISICNNNRYWFNCDVCDHSFEKRIAELTSNLSWCPYCAKYNNILCNDLNCKHCLDKSLASYEEKTPNGKFKIDCWDKEKNKNINPRNINISSGLKFWFKCDICNHSFNKQISSINLGSWCPYCVRYKLCNNKCDFCYNNSFASYEGKTSNGKFKINCWNNEKNNNIIPRNITLYTNKKYWFVCDECNNNFKSTISHITLHTRWCPYCVNKTEKILYNWLKENLTHKIKFQPKYEWCRNIKTNKYLPFDFSIEELKLIFEVDGLQHFEQVSKWESPEKTFERDKYKIEKAINEGYTIIRIFQEDIYYNKNNWKSNVIEIIKSYEKPQLICLGNEDKYRKYNDIIIN